MLKWMKKKFQSMTEANTEVRPTDDQPLEYSDIEYFRNMDETLEWRDDYYVKLTKLALGPASVVLEKYILHYFENGVTVNIRTVDRILPNVLKLAGIASLQNGSINTFTFVLPVHLIMMSVSTEDTSLLIKFTDDYQKLLKGDSITEEDLIKIMTIFTKNESMKLSDVSEYNAILVKTGVDDVMGFDKTDLTEEQMKSFVRTESGTIN